MLGGLIDFHAHLPWWPRSVEAKASRLLLEMDRAGVEKSVVIAIEVSLRDFRRMVSEGSIVEAAMEAADLLVLSGVRYLEDMILDPARAIKEHEELIGKYRTTSYEVAEAGRISRGRLVGVASLNPDLGFEGNSSMIRSLGSDVLGVKIFPTLHFIDPSDPRLDVVYDAVRSIGGLVIVHTGCDPGVWELPKYCSRARPSLVAKAARRHRDLAFVVAHLGAYSALKPGIYFEEALKALEEPNVYADTSAADPLFVELAVREVGSDKILFGSDYPYVAGSDMLTSVREIQSLSINESDKNRILRANAERLLKKHGRWA